jgi:protein phosphatase
MSGPITRVPAPVVWGGAVDGAGLSHVGAVRSVNEDAILTDPTGVLWAVADGVGGYGFGDIAAELAIDALARIPHGYSDRTVLVAAVVQANEAVRNWAANAGVRRMGATIVATLIRDGGAVVAWVGDSRAYLYRDGTLRQVTRDHSLVQDLLRDGRITAEQAKGHPQSNVITRALGADDTVDVDVADVELRSGDVMVLCSDGLTGCVPDATIATILGEKAPAEAACRRFVETALAAGAPDNVSVIVVRIGVAP